MTLVSFVLGMSILAWSGWAVARQAVPRSEKLLHALVALPIGALMHALLLAGATLLGAPLAWYVLLPMHLVLGGTFLVAPTPLRPVVPMLPSVAPWMLDRPIRNIVGILLASQCLFAVMHAAVLPTYHIDSLTNWTMRAKVSWLDERLAFDDTEIRGVAKPQYPFLVHGVQMAAHVVASDWSDRSANMSTLLITATSLGALFVLLRLLRGTTIALAVLAAVTHVPLLSFHLAQGYGDIHLVTAILLSLVFLLAARIIDDARWLVGSALFIGVACWTKTEGAIIGLLPWTLLLAADLPRPHQRRHRVAGLSIGLVLSLCFPLFLFLKGLPFTPHASDASVGFHMDALGPALAGFISPSMGLTWPAILLVTLVAVVHWRKRDPHVDSRVIPTLAWGLLALFIVLSTYTFTPNARFLLNGESYFRQLMLPAAMFILVLGVAMRRPS